MKKIVIFGGSFNPIHFGHLKMIRSAMKQVGALEGWFLIADQAPLKDEYETSYFDRVEMVKIMIKPYRHLKLCEVERNLPKPNYTINTLNYLYKKYPNVKFYFLIGSDQAIQLDKWKDSEKLFDLTTFIVYPRDNIRISDRRLLLLKPLEGMMEVSSTMIREMKSFDTHPAILRKIAMEGLYSYDRLKAIMSGPRIKHVMGVVDLIERLANKHRQNAKLAKALAINHDLLKEKDSEYLIHYLSKEELETPKYNWHAYAVTSFLAKKCYVLDKKFLNAIYHHVDGNSNHIYGKLLFIADKCEANREYNTGFYVNEALKNIHKAHELVKENSKKYNERVDI